MFADISTIWGNTDGCVDKYCRATAMYLLSMLVHAYNIIIDIGVGAPGHDREVVSGFNANDKMFISMLTTTVQLPGAASYDSQMEIYTSTANTYISLARESQKNISDPTYAYGLLYRANDIKRAS